MDLVDSQVKSNQDVVVILALICDHITYYF